MMKVSVLGAAGGIGQPLSLLLKNQLPAGSHLALYDVAPVVPGVAVDLSHIPTPVKVTGHAADDLEAAVADADIIVIPAGVPRKPGMTRDDLFNVNAGIVQKLVETGAKAAPNACYAIITNPVNSTVPIAAETLKKAGVYDPRRVFGVTMLDVIRSNTFVGELKGINPDDVDVTVIGGHSGNTILPLLSQQQVAFTDAELDALVPKIQNADTEVVEAKAGGGSATLSMADAGARFTLALARGLAGDMNVECCFVAVENGPADYFAQPVRLGPNGVEEILSYGTLSDREQGLMEAMLDELKGNISKGVAFVDG